MRMLISTNPAKNYQKIGSVPVSSPKEICQKVKMANKAKKLWKEAGIEKRIQLLEPMIKLLKDKQKELALLITREIGKPIKESIEDINWDFDYLKAFFQDGKKYLAEEITYKTKSMIHKVVHEPLGVVAVLLSLGIFPALIFYGVLYLI